LASAAPTVVNGSGSSTGINAGFGNAVGANSSLTVTFDTVSEVNWILTTGGGNLDNANAVVIYIDVDNGGEGYADTKSFNDVGSSFFDELRAATSATNGTERADVTFAPGFLADYALVFNSGFGVSYRLDAVGHQFIGVISGAGFGMGGPYHFSHPLIDLGLAPGDSFRYFLTYLDPVGTYRSNEFHGVADASVPDSNIGFDDVTLAAGDFNVFHSGNTGDFNASGFVDGGDLLMIQRGLGKTHTANDLTTFKQNFGVVYSAPAFGAVPEPCSASLAVLAVIGLGVRRRRN
jgi:hypothetical protein